MRCLGIDYGTKRIGLSQGDEIGVATPLPALTEGLGDATWQKLAELIKQRRITDLVVGYPYNMDGSVGFKAKEVDEFAGKLKGKFGLPVHLVDETLTSYEAESTIAKKNRRAVLPLHRQRVEVADLRHTHIEIDVVIVVSHPRGT